LWGFTLIVALSAVFIGQHWIMDVMGGTLLGVIGYYLSLAIAARLRPAPHRCHRRSSQ
jgi:membrane-associated phospholipid phosphatase